jgi:succinate dehydrogenase / fumarate reductase, iron-sulfur subunit
MLDALNEDLLSREEPPVAFEHDCREGICGSCGFLINGVAHGGQRGTTVCQLSMRFFKDGDSLTLEPWRARAFPVIRDLIVNRSAFDRIIQAGGFISAPTGSAPDANAILVPKEAADTAFDAAACIGCGACVAACPNAAAMLFTSAKITHLNTLPQGRPQRDQRTLSMVVAMMNEHFGSSTANWANTPGGRPQIHRWSRPWRHEPPDSFQSRIECSSPRFKYNDYCI